MTQRREDIAQARNIDNCKKLDIPVLKLKEFIDFTLASGSIFTERNAETEGIRTTVHSGIETEDEHAPLRSRVCIHEGGCKMQSVKCFYVHGKSSHSTPLYCSGDGEKRNSGQDFIQSHIRLYKALVVNFSVDAIPMDYPSRFDFE